jgi:hypothetical protein
MVVVWIVAWILAGMPEVALITRWNIGGVAFIGAVAVDLTMVLWSQHRALADLHLFGRTYVPDEGWLRDPEHKLGTD